MVLTRTLISSLLHGKTEEFAAHLHHQPCPCLEPQQEFPWWCLITDYMSVATTRLCPGWKETGRLWGVLVFRGCRNPEQREGLHLCISKLWFLWGLTLLVSGSFCWVISISGNKTGFCLSLIFPIILSLLMQRNTVEKNTCFEGKP